MPEALEQARRGARGGEKPVRRFDAVVCEADREIRRPPPVGRAGDRDGDRGKAVHSMSITMSLSAFTAAAVTLTLSM